MKEGGAPRAATRAAPEAMIRNLPFSKLWPAAALLAAACVTPTYKSLGLPPDKVAILEGNPTTYQVLGLDKRIQFLEVDGESQFRGSGRGYPNKIDLLPGTHTLLVGYSIYVDSQFHERGELNAQVTVEAGKRYEIDLVQDGPGGWTTQLVELGASGGEAEVRPAQDRHYD
jgi:hypothetical protein